MKAFEEFWETFRKELEGDYTIDDVFFAREIWKAAFRQIKNYIDKGHSRGEISDYISKELEK